MNYEKVFLLEVAKFPTGGTKRMAQPFMAEPGGVPMSTELQLCDDTARFRPVSSVCFDNQRRENTQAIHLDENVD